MRLARKAALLCFGVVAIVVLVMIASENYAALLFVLPATVAATVSVLWPGNPFVLWVAAGLVFLNIVLLLIGWVGLLFVPSFVLLLLAAVRVQRTGR